MDLFAGCGGLTLGIAQAARAHGFSLEIPLAVDFERIAAEVYRANFPGAKRVDVAPVQSLFDGDPGKGDEPRKAFTLAEARIHKDVGAIDALIGGPPCQGHSNLNNHTRRVDAKNALYLRMVRAAQVLEPRIVLIENVPAVVNDRHDGEGVVTRAEARLNAMGYRVEARIIPIAQLGVAQTRRRHVMIATMPGEQLPGDLFDELEASAVSRDLQWAIGDLTDSPERATTIFDKAPQAKVENLKRMQWLLDRPGVFDLPNELRPECHRGDHSYKSMYGQLRWNEPAQTITSGYGSIGQGRYMHPSRPRALTAHEAARIQGFPDYFDFSACRTRSELSVMIGNAVPPQVGERVFSLLLDFRENSRISRERGYASGV
ncbi:hypothetical protein ASG80_12415 [Agromyces sp. Soil535]|nr:hypothetical protein ASG80_12415 [Agromyces sp. Soil535]